MAPVVGGVNHDPIKAPRRLEQAQEASAIAVALLMVRQSYSSIE
jgi:hypothetical protein